MRSGPFPVLLRHSGFGNAFAFLFLDRFQQVIYSGAALIGIVRDGEGSAATCSLA
jgi:hypothetical protein